MSTLLRGGFLVFVVLSSLAAQPTKIVFKNSTSAYTQNTTSRTNFFNADSISRAIVWRPYDRSTMAVQSAMGLADAALCLLSYQAMRNPGGVGPLLLLVAVPAALALPGIEYYFGEEMGGDGSLFWTITGSIAGAVVVNIPGLGSWSNDIRPIAIVTAIAAVGGGILGYHYFARPVYEAGSARANVREPYAGFDELWAAVSGDHGLRVSLLSIGF